MNIELLQRLCRLRGKATGGRWYASQPYTIGDGSGFVSVGPHEGPHFEETIAEFWDGDGQGEINAQLVVELVNNIETICSEVEKISEFITGIEQAFISDDFHASIGTLLMAFQSERAFKVIKPNSPDQSSPRGNPKIFVGGSIDNGAAIMWQPLVEQRLSSYSVTLFNPRRDDWNPDLNMDISNPVFNQQVNWELDSIDDADIVFLNFDPKGLGPITLMELGHVSPKKKIIVCCPDGYWRKGNVQIMCQRNNYILFDEFELALDYLETSVGNLS